jgi:hypothetical protein
MKNKQEIIDFLNGELKKIEEQIKSLGYAPGSIAYQERLWALRDNISGKINDLNIAQQYKE